MWDMGAGLSAAPCPPYLKRPSSGWPTPGPRLLCALLLLIFPTLQLVFGC